MESFSVPESRLALRRWLGGQWALYFSHPQDFARFDFEADRWHVMLQDGFDAAGVRALGPAREGTLPGGSWVEVVGGRLAELPAPSTAKGRFVATYDDKLRLRSVFSYANALSLPSPLDLAAGAVAQRQRVARRRAQRASQLTCAVFVLATATVAAFTLRNSWSRPAKAVQ